MRVRTSFFSLLLLVASPVLVPQPISFDRLGGVKVPGFADRKLASIKSIQANLRSTNRGSFHASPTYQNLLVEVLAEDKGLFSQEQLGYSFRLPEGWQAQPPSPQGEVVITSPKGANDLANPPVLKITATPINDLLDPQILFDRVIGRFGMLFGEFSFQDAQHIEVDGWDGFVLIYTYADKGVKVKAIDFLLLAQKKLYEIVGSAPAQDFGSYEATFRAFFDSFKIIPLPNKGDLKGPGGEEKKPSAIAKPPLKRGRI